MDSYTKLISIAMLAVASVNAFGGRPSRPVANAETAVNGAALGRDYARVLAETYADAWRAAAETLEKGGTVADAQKVLQGAWTASRVKAFKSRVAPQFARVLPEGEEPTDAASRARVATLWRSFASGLKGAH